MDDAASSAASSTGHTSSLSDSHSSAELSWSQPQSGSAISRGRRFWRRIARRLSGGRFGGINEEDFQREPTMRTAMYRTPPLPLPPGAAAEEAVGLGEDDHDDKAAAQRGLKEKQERLERAARLLEQRQHGAMAQI